jgi:2-oxoisovalerate dehydrogenase E1 component alpha subunit
MSQEITGILAPDGTPVPGAKLPELSSEDLMLLYRTMVLNRRIDERMTRLQRQGRIGFFVGSTGEEAAIVGSAFALKKGDWVVPCYREIGAALLRGYPLYDFVCQLFGNEQDAIKGRQMPCHWGSSALQLASVSSTVGSQIPQATGIAHAMKISGKKEAVLTYFGDGATSEGDFHVALNFAGVFKVPVVFFCRNNQWAISVPLAKQTASESIAIKARAYGIEGGQVDGNDVLAVYVATKQALTRARQGDGPTLIEALTYRQGAHTTSDDPRAYRDDSEVEVWKDKDPIQRFERFLLSQGYLGDGDPDSIEKELDEQILTTLKEVEELGPPQLESMVEDVFREVPWHLQEQLEELKESLQ